MQTASFSSLEDRGEQGRDRQVAQPLYDLSDANRWLGLRQEGIQQGKESLDIYKWLGDTTASASCLIRLAFPLVEEKQVDAAEEAASNAIDLIPSEGDQFAVCGCHRIFGNICRSKGEVEKATDHYNINPGVASFEWHVELYWAYYALAEVFRDQDRFNEAHSHLEHAKSHAMNDVYQMGRVAELHAKVWSK